MTFDPNPLFYWMLQNYISNKTADNKITFCNEGGSRSSKTYDEFHLLYWICDQLRNSEAKLEIYIARRTLKRCRELTFKDFRECLTVMGVYNSNNCFSENVAPVYDLFGHKLHFIGLDSSMEAVRSDIFFLNEALEVETEDLISGWCMRCEMLQLFDWNPSVTQHWIFTWEGRPNTYFSKTTYKNNKHLKPSIIAGIEALNPDNPENIKNGTANIYKWNVYGLGLRSAREGLVYPIVYYLDAWPEHINYFNYGLDFGFTNDPTAVSKVAIDKVNKIIYAECLMYQSTATSGLLSEALISIGINGKDIIIADSADAFKTSMLGFVGDLRTKGFTVIKAKKPSGYKTEAIAKVHEYKLVIINTKFVVKLPGGATGDPAKFELQNYVWQEINGKSVNVPMDGNDHFLDSLLYAVQSFQLPMTVA